MEKPYAPYSIYSEDYVNTLGLTAKHATMAEGRQWERQSRARRQAENAQEMRIMDG